MAIILHKYEAGLLYPARNLVQTSRGLYEAIHRELSRSVGTHIAKISRPLLRGLIHKLPATQLTILGKGEIELEIMVLDIRDQTITLKLCFPFHGGMAGECRTIYEALISKLNLSAEANDIGLIIKILLSGEDQPIELKFNNTDAPPASYGQRFFITTSEACELRNQLHFR